MECESDCGNPRRCATPGRALSLGETSPDHGGVGRRGSGAALVVGKLRRETINCTLDVNRRMFGQLWKCGHEKHVVNRFDDVFSP